MRRSIIGELAASAGRIGRIAERTIPMSENIWALLARLNPLVVPFTAFLFGVIAVGTGAIQRQLGIPFPLVWIIEGVVILTFLLIGHLRARRLAALAGGA